MRGGGIKPVETPLDGFLIRLGLKAKFIMLDRRMTGLV